jgi:hypothetical protein
MNQQEQAARNAEAAKKLKLRILLQLKRGAGKGVEAAVRFLAARVKEAVSVPAPKKPIRGAVLSGKKLGPILGYRATTPAVSGAPPRMLSGKLRAGVTHKMLTATIGLVGTHKKYPDGFNYPKYHELGKEERLGGGKHQFIKPVVDKYSKELKALVGAAVKLELRGIS